MSPWDLQETLFYLRLPIETFFLCLCRSRQCDRRLHQRRHTSLPLRSECPGVEPAGPWQNQHHTGCVCICEGGGSVRVWVSVSMRWWGCEWEKEERYTLDTLCHFCANGGWRHPPQTFGSNCSDNYCNRQPKTIYYTQSATNYNNLWVVWFIKL